MALTIGQAQVPWKSVQDNQGTQLFRYLFELTPARSLIPSITLSASTSTSSSIWGVGFQDDAVMSIQRNTTFGCANYEDTSTHFKEGFVHNQYGVLLLLPSTGRETQKTFNDVTYAIQYYQPRSADALITIEHWQADGTPSFWIIREHDGVIHTLGDAEEEKTASTIQDPQDPQKIFQWNIRETRDAAGNVMRYEYSSDDHQPNLYLERLLYNNYLDEKQETHYACSLDFSYGLVKQNHNTFSPPTAAIRPDIAMNYRAGFLIAQQRLCYRIELRHHFVQEAIPDALVHYWEFEYQNSQGLSQLQKITSVGRRIDLKGQEVLQTESSISFSYTTFGADEKAAFHAIALPQDASTPAGLGTYHLVDLYQEGLPGILCIQDHIPLFWRNQGSGEFSAPVSLSPFPLQRELNGNDTLMPWGEAANWNLIIKEPFQCGTYALDTSQNLLSWSGFTSFDTAPIEDHLQWIDITGNGQADALCLQPDHPYFYPHLGDQAFESAKPLVFPELKSHPNPWSDSDRLTARIFMDLFGDSSLHRIVMDGQSLTVWPNLGNGKFGEPQQWSLPTYQGEWTSTRAQLADVTGTGTADLLYLYPDRIDIYLNHGQRFSQTPFSIALPAPLNDNDILHVGDILGMGTPSLWFTHISIEGVQHYYANPCATQPFLLKDIQHSSGLHTTLSYTSSTQNYLQNLHQKAPIPYPKLPFSMTLLHMVTETDTITGITCKKTYEHHGGNYDRSYREFTGFTMVEHTQLDNDGKAIQGEYRKRWFCNGPTANIQTLMAQQNAYQKYYYSITPTIAIESAFANTGDEKISDSLQSQAVFSLKRQWLREEIYTLNENLPLSVSENSYAVFLEPATDNQGSFVIQPLDVVHYHVEQQKEIRIERDLSLAWNLEAHPIKTLHIAYGRQQAPSDLGEIFDKTLHIIGENRKKILSLQSQNLILYQEHQYAPKLIAEKNDDLHTFLYGKVVLSTQQYDLSNTLHINTTMSEVQIDSALKKLSNEELNGSLIRGHTHSYWADLDQTTIWVPTVPLTIQPLLHHVEELLGSDSQVKDWYTPLLLKSDNDLTQPLTQAGFLEHHNAWWQPKPVRYYQKAFRLLAKMVNIETAEKKPSPFDADLWRLSEYVYDPYAINVLKATQWLWQYPKSPSRWSTIFSYDYQTILPHYIIDTNQNTEIRLYDALGRLLATTRYGQLVDEVLGNPLPASKDPLDQQLITYRFNLLQKINQSSLSEVLKHPTEILAHWTHVYIYQNQSKNHTPPYAIQLNTFCYEHQHTPLESQVPNFQITVGYQNAYHHPIQTKQQLDATTSTWHSSGLMDYSAEGLSLTEYLPYESQSGTYDSKECIEKTYSALLPPLYNRYDTLHRLIEQISPKGYLRNAQYTPWANALYDENDTLHQTLPDLKLSAQEAKVINQTLATEHAHTPTLEFINAQGEITAEVEILHIDKDYRPLLTLTTYDAKRQPLSYQDPRLSIPHTTLSYNLLGQITAMNDVNDSTRYQLHNRESQKYRSAKNQWLHIWRYDSFSRLLSTQSAAIHTDTPNLIHTEARMYGEQLLDPNKKIDPSEYNLCGQLISLSTADNRIEHLAFNLDGRKLITTKKLFLPNLEDFSPSDTPTPYKSYQANGESIQFSTEFSIEGQLLSETIDSESTLAPAGKRINDYNGLGLIMGVKYQADEKAPALSLSNLTYDVNQHYRTLMYGNGLITTFEYDPKTQNVMHLQTQDKKKQPVLNLSYLWDPTGNLLSTQQTKQAFTFNKKTIELPDIDALSTYDTLYRLTQCKDELEGKADDFSTYTENFFYNDSDNIEKITHQGQHSWMLQYNVDEKSDRLNQISDSQSGNKDITYGACGEIQQIGSDQIWEWDYDTRLIKFNSTTLEIYGYSKETPEHKHTALSHPTLAHYSPHFFGSTIDHQHSLPSYQTREFKRSQKKLSNTETETLEEVYIGNHQRKRLFRTPQGQSATLVLECHRYHLRTPLGLLATFYCWLKDDLGLEVNGKPSNTHPVYACEYHVVDHLGSVKLDTDSTATPLVYREYDAFGDLSFVLSASSSVLSRQPYQYSSTEKDESGAYAYGDRYYHPYLSRWLSPDPAGLINGLNPYAFVTNNPLTYIDWNGDVKVLKREERVSRTKQGPVPLYIKGGISKKTKKGITKRTAVQVKKDSDVATEFHKPTFKFLTGTTRHRLALLVQNPTTGENAIFGYKSGIGNLNTAQTAAHTEPKAMYSTQVTDPDDHYTMIGREPPCTSCQGHMTDFITSATTIKPAKAANKHLHNPKRVLYLSLKGKKTDKIPGKDPLKHLTVWKHAGGKSRRFIPKAATPAEKKWLKGIVEGTSKGAPYQANSTDHGSLTTKAAPDIF